MDADVRAGVGCQRWHVQVRWNVGSCKCSDERRKVGDVGVQEFNKGIFDYLIATDDPAKRLEQEEEAAKPAPQLKPAPVKAKGKGRDRDSRKRGRGNERRENDSEFGVIRGIDFQGVKTVINVDVPESVQVTIHALLILHFSIPFCFSLSSSRRCLQFEQCDAKFMNPSLLQQSHTAQP